MESQFAQITQLFGMMSGSLGWENHFQGSSPRENAHDSLLTVAEIGSQSGLRVSGHLGGGGALVDYSVPRVSSTVSPARMASSNMGEGCPHDDGSSGQGHSKGQHPGWEFETAGILETEGQVTFRTAMTGHVFV